MDNAVFGVICVIMMKNSNKGFIAIIVAVFAPIIMSLFYLYMRDSFSTTNKSVTDTATQEAALEAARNYYDARFINFDKQSEFLDRKTSTAFSSVMKSLVGISHNIFNFEQQKIGYISERYIPDNVVYNLERIGQYKTSYDADCDVLDSIISSAEYLIRKDNSNEVERFVLKRKNTADNLLSISKINEDVLRVETDIALQRGFGQTHRYKSSYKATAPKCNVDIILGIPTNYATCTVENRNHPKIQGAPEKTPISEISRALRRFVKRLLPVRKCAIGVVPYSGSVSFYGNQPMKAHKAEELDEKTLSIPVYNSYAYLCKKSGDKLDSKYLSSQYGVTGVMFRDELLYDDALYDPFDSTTKFHVFPTNICHAGDASVASGFCKINSEFRPNLYPIFGLTEDKLKVYRFLGLLSPHNADELHKSNFTYLPIMFGTSMLKGTYVPPGSPYRSNSAAKKVAIIIANEADKFKPGELTYFGFNNDAAHVSMIEGDKIDFEKGNLVKTEDGYFANTAENNVYGEYYKKMRLKTSYTTSDSSRITKGDVIIPSKQNMRFTVSSMPSVLIYKQNGHFDDVNIIQVSSPKNTVIIDRGAYYQCHVPKKGTSISVQYSGDRPVLVKMELYECEIKGGQDPIAHTIRQDPNFVYVCRQADGEVPGIVTMEFETATITHDWPAISYFKDQLIDGITAVSSIIDTKGENNIQVCNINLTASATFNVAKYVAKQQKESEWKDDVSLANKCVGNDELSDKCKCAQCDPWYAMSERCRYYSNNPDYNINDGRSGSLSSSKDNWLSVPNDEIKINSDALSGKSTGEFGDHAERFEREVKIVNSLLKGIGEIDVFKSARDYVKSKLAVVFAGDKCATNSIYESYYHHIPNSDKCNAFKEGDTCLLCEHLDKYNKGVESLFLLSEEWLKAFGDIPNKNSADSKKNTLQTCINNAWDNNENLLLNFEDYTGGLSADGKGGISGSTQNVIAEHALRNVQVMRSFVNNRVLQLEDEIKDLETIRTNLTNKHEEEIKKLKDQIKKAEEDLAEANTDLRNAKNEKKTVEEKLAEANTDLRNAENEKKTVEEKLAEANTNLSNVENKKKAAEEELKSKNKELSDLNLQIKQLQEDLKNSSAAAERMFEDEITKINNETTQLRKEYNLLVARANDAAKKLKFITAINLRKKAHSVLNKISRLNVEVFWRKLFKPLIVSVYKHRNEQAINAKIGEAEKKVKTRLDEIRSLSEKIDGYEDEINKKKIEITEYQDAIYRQNERINEQKNKISGLCENKISLSNKIQTLETTISDLNNDISGLKEKVLTLGAYEGYIDTEISSIKKAKEKQKGTLEDVQNNLGNVVKSSGSNVVTLTINYSVSVDSRGEYKYESVDIPIFFKYEGTESTLSPFYDCAAANAYCNGNNQGCYKICKRVETKDVTIPLQGDNVLYYTDVTLHITPPEKGDDAYLAGGAYRKSDARSDNYSDEVLYPPTTFSIKYYESDETSSGIKRHATSTLIMDCSSAVMFARENQLHDGNDYHCRVFRYPTDTSIQPNVDDGYWTSKWSNNSAPYFTGNGVDKIFQICEHNKDVRSSTHIIKLIGNVHPGPINVSSDQQRIGMVKIEKVTYIPWIKELEETSEELTSSYGSSGFSPALIDIKTERTIDAEMHTVDDEEVKVGENATLSFTVAESKTSRLVASIEKFERISVQNIKIITLEPHHQFYKRKMKMAQQYPYVRIYKTNKHSKTTIKQVKCQGEGVIVESDEGDYVDCFIKDDSADFLILLSEMDPDIPVLCMLDMFSCDIESSNQCVMQDASYVYLCSKTDDTTCTLTVKRINSEVEQHQHKTLSFYNGRPMEKEEVVVLSGDQLKLYNSFNVDSTIYGKFKNNEYDTYNYHETNTGIENYKWYSLVARCSVPVDLNERLLGEAGNIYTFDYVNRVFIESNGRLLHTIKVGEILSAQGAVVMADVELLSDKYAQSASNIAVEIKYEYYNTNGYEVSTELAGGLIEKLLRRDPPISISYMGDILSTADVHEYDITADFEVAMNIANTTTLEIEAKYNQQSIESIVKINDIESKKESRVLAQPFAYLKYGCSAPQGPTAYFSKLIIRPNIQQKREFKSIITGNFQFTGGVSNQHIEYPIDGGVTQIFVPKDHITSEKISFTLTDAYLSSIEWCNALETEGNVYSERIDDETATKRRRNADRFEDLKTAEQEDPEDIFDDEKLKPVRIKYKKPKELKYSRLLDLSTRSLKNNFLNTLQHASFMDSVMYSDRMYYPEGYLLQNSKKTKFEITKVVDALSEYYENDYDDIDSGDITLIADNFFNESQMYVFNGDKAGYLNGLNRFFYKHKYGKKHVFATSSNSASKCPSRLKAIESTYPVNRILERWCNQSVDAGVLSRSGTQIMRDEVSVEASRRFNKEFGRNGRLYLIKYRCTPENSKALSKLNAYKIYTANNEQQLDSALQKIMADVEQFADYSDAKIVN